MRLVGGVSLFLLTAVALAQATPKPSRADLRPKTYGTSDVGYIEVPGDAFMPADSGTTYGTGPQGWSRYSTNCLGLPCFSAPLHLPSGAKVVYLELTFVDTDPAYAVLGSLVVCDLYSQDCLYHPSAGAGPADCLATGHICSGNAFVDGEGFQSADLTPDGMLDVDNLSSSYRLVAGGGFSSSTAIGGMVVGYVLQVSAPPPTADFADVPTSHPLFQFIEALYHSGITAGCGGGNYCPDSPVTRGQMAVFLAKALGLQFP